MGVGWSRDGGMKRFNIGGYIWRDMSVGIATTLRAKRYRHFAVLIIIQ